jgi:hypothetical protein
MTDLRAAAQQALEALEHDAVRRTFAGDLRIANAVIDLRAALEQQDEQVSMRPSHTSGW